MLVRPGGSSTHLGYQVRSFPVDASKRSNQTNAERSSFRWGLPPSDGNRNQQATATRSPSRRGLPPSDDDPMVACVAPLHAHRKASGRATPTRETPQKVCTAPCESFIMQRMVTAPIPLYSPNDITRVQSRAGGWIASFDFDVASTSTPSQPIIASPNESLDDSSITTSILTGPFCCNQQYSVTAITTSTSAIAERYAYTAYGQPTILNASGLPLAPQSSTLSNRYSYTGREWDATLGLHHFRARWMSPNAGRFLGRDPIGYEGSEWGLYELLDSHVLTFQDAFGLHKCRVCTEEQQRSVERCCADGEILGYARGVWGRAFCCDGRMVGCVYMHNYPPTTPRARREIEYCIGKHERRHVGDAAPCRDVCGDTNLITYPDGWDDNRSECNALVATVQCLWSKIKNCTRREPLCTFQEHKDLFDLLVLVMRQGDSKCKYFSLRINLY
jgi:RHS repeat-associated protein